MEQSRLSRTCVSQWFFLILFLCLPSHRAKKLSHSIIASSQLSLSPPRWSVQFVWTWISALIIIKSCVVVCYMRVSIFSKAFSSLSWTDFDIQYEWKKNVLILPVAFVHCSNMKH
ncbi:hypothetical protein T4A_13706 [Trichinella pseudospiralis]|uniref:Uncharacterized protein n=1 Tax=Trichinella pseudospiralis TaxID=6337 RepID=A0A0V1EQ02_TRIPS|nr:hypothetical protein T4A_13706 [Trichinella pseudospiralis]